MIKSIQKRDGRIALYDERKIASAILKAMEAAGEGNAADAARVANQVETSLEASFGEKPPAIEDIQDQVEDKLMESGFDKAAKKYILYRASRTRVREMNTGLMKIFDELTNADSGDSDLKRDNANIDGDTAMGTMLKYGSEAAKDYYEKYLLTPEQGEAHRSGDIHIHDFDFYSLTTTCCQIQLSKLFKGGFSTGHGFLREPNDIQSYSALACIAIQSNQNDQHGGQSVVDFDYGLAPGVAKTYRKNYLLNLYKALKLLRLAAFTADGGVEGADGGIGAGASPGCPSLAEIKSMAAHVEEARGLAPRIDGDVDYRTCERIALRDRGLDDSLVARAQDFAAREALAETEKATYQAMEALIHNLNTMHSRAGAQTPFSSVNYGTDTSSEGRMVIRNVLKATEAGLGMGETPIFPIQIFRVKEGVNYNEGDPNHDLFIRACEVSAKRLFPNFAFLDSPFNLQYYEPGRPETEVAYMGCRTRVMGNVFDPGKQVSPGRGNLSFTSVNLPRIAIESEGDEERFYALLGERMDLVVRQLLDRFAIQCRKHVYNFPFLMGQGVWIDSEKLGYNDCISEVLKHGTLSLGFIGLAETLTALYGQHHGESEAMQEKGLAIVGFMRNRLDGESRSRKLNFTLLATPAEGLSGRFVRLDRERFGTIPGVTDKDYYTNSFHIPVGFGISAFDKIRLEAPYHALTNAGHISYVELDGDAANNIEAFVSIVRCMHDAGIGYGSVNHPVDRDPICGYTGIIGEVCPRCGRREGEPISPAKLRELLRKYPDMPIAKYIKAEDLIGGES
jgi:ribonucleoside-triphosphate reductase